MTTDMVMNALAKTVVIEYLKQIGTVQQMYKCDSKLDILVQYKACTWVHSFIYPVLILIHVNDEIKPLNKVAQLE